MISRIVHLNDLTFDDWAARQPGVTIITVGAAACAQSRELRPILEHLGAKYAGQARFGTVDFEESTEFVANFNVTGVPELIVLSDGRVMEVLARCSQLESATIDNLISRAIRASSADADHAPESGTADPDDTAR